MGYTKEERETHIWINEIDNEYYCIETNMFSYINKYNKLWYEIIKSLEEDGKIIDATYKVPKFAISFRKPVKRTVTEEQRQKASERFKNMWEKKNEAEQ